MNEPRASRPVVSRLLSMLLGPLWPWFRLLGLGAQSGNASENHFWNNVE